MSHIPGMYLSQSAEREGHAVWRSACREAGRAIGLLTRTPLAPAQRAHCEAAFYRDCPTLEAYARRIVTLGRSIQARDPGFRDGFWKGNLDFIEAHLGALFAQPRVLYDQDVANFHVQGGRFMGFFDLEMCRAGCAAMQLGATSFLADDSDECWSLLVEGWEAGTGARLNHADLQAAAAARHLLCWREISRYLSYDGTPGTGYEWAEPADPARYRRHIEIARRRFGGP
jgi:hypothetical protein